MTGLEIACIIVLVTIAVLAFWLFDEIVARAKAETEAKGSRKFINDLLSEKEELEEKLGTVPSPAPRAVPSSRATALDADRFTRIWRGVQDDTELYLAVHQLLALELVAAIDDAANPALADRPGALAAAQGQVAALLTFAATLDTARLNPEQWLAKPR